MAAIRQQINIDAAPRTVWRLLTTAEGLSSWLVDEVERIDARNGGVVILKTMDDDGEMVEERGMFHEVRPTRKLEIKWDSNSPAPTRGTRVTFQVARDGEETRLSVVHSGPGILEDEEARAELEKGWRQAMRALRSSLES